MSLLESLSNCRLLADVSASLLLCVCHCVHVCPSPVQLEFLFMINPVNLSIYYVT